MKRKLAPRQLQGLAMNWWNVVTIATPEDYFSWEQFKILFEEKFISTA